MSRPPLEVADLVRAAGDAFIERSRKWITWKHVKVLLAIARSLKTDETTNQIMQRRKARLGPLVSPHKRPRVSRRSFTWTNSRLFVEMDESIVWAEFHKFRTHPTLGESGTRRFFLSWAMAPCSSFFHGRWACFPLPKTMRM